MYRQGDSYVINGRKWWTSGAMDTRCRLLIVMVSCSFLVWHGSVCYKIRILINNSDPNTMQGKTDFNAAKHKQQSMILVDIQTPGVLVKRPLMVFGFDDAPHGHAEVIFENVQVPVKNILLGEGRGFEIAQV